MYQKTTTKGFTLVETMIAVFILAISIGGPMTIVTRGLQASFFARDQIIAFYLAEEAIEYVRLTRDSNTLAAPSRPWLDGLDACRGGNVCDVDVKNSTIISCSSGCPPLRYDEATNFYNHTTGQNSPFTREVTMEPVNADEEIVRVTVSWRTGLQTRDFTVKEHIFNWQQN